MMRARIVGLPAPLAWAALAIVLILGLAWENLANALDPSDRFQDHGITGPYTWAVRVEGAVETGPLLTAVAPGQSFGVVSTFCPGRREPYFAIVRLVRVSNGHVEWRREREFQAGARRCGQEPATLSVPLLAPPGSYRLEREAIFGAQLGPATGRRAVIEPLNFEVRP